MSTQNYQDYKPSKKIKEQLDYLEEKKRVRFINMDRDKIKCIFEAINK